MRNAQDECRCQCVQKRLREVVASRVQPAQLVIDGIGQPIDRLIMTDMSGRETPAERGCVQAAIVRIVQKVFRIIPVDEVVVDDG